ncbi:RNA-binding ribosome biosynthesis protein mak21, partial [Coemansia sp. S16]
MAKKDGGVQRGKPNNKKAPQADVAASEEANAGPGDAVLWEEIQKLGGGMDDLNLLQDIDTGKSGKSSAKSQKVDKKALQGDLAAFAKSLGLATSIPDFVGLTESEQKQVANDKKSETKKSKDKHGTKSDSAATEATPKTAAVPTATTAAAAKKEKKSKDTRGSKGDSVAAEAAPKTVAVPATTTATPAKKEKKAKKDSSKAVDTQEDVVDIPGFKVKSAMDSMPQTKSSKLTIEPMPQWFSVALGALETDEGAAKPTEDEVLQKSAYAEQLLDGENALYDKRGANKKSLSTSDRSFVSNILSSGTLSDRVSALTLIVQESPVHNLKSLGQLMAMVQKKNRREALMAVGSVKDLMSLNLLPPNRKLKYFADQPINARGITNAHWIMWAFEDKLKRHYFDLIQVMESMSYDPVLHTRQNMVNYFEELLEQKPEQEQNLLRLLVNKLGDNERQLAAKASYLLLKLLNVHPNMKYVVVKTVQELLLTKSSTKERTQYYTMITLNQIILSSKDVSTANLLLEVYFIFFTKLLKITKDNDEAEAEAANDEADSDGEKTRKAAADTKPAGKKGAPKKVYIGQKAMLKAKEDAEKKRAEEERSMDNKLLAAILTGLNRALPFSKMDDEVMDKHIGVIFQIAHAGNFNTVVQSLVLLNQVVRIRPGIGDRFYRTLYDSLLDPRLDSTSKKAMYLNVLFRALKADSDIPRVMAFIKRIMQVCLYNQAEFVSGALFLVSQILSLNPQIYKMLTQPEDDDDDDEEKAEASRTKYDAQKRDPRYAQADASCMWEATLLMRHFHPSVTHSIKQIFDGEQVPAISNLHNHSLTHFLDRFVFRKPKGEEGSGGVDEDGERIGAAPTAKSSTHRGQSIMQPVIQKDGPDMELGPNRTRVATGDYLIASKRTGGVVGGLDLTLDSITDLQKSDVPPDEQFFHQFFQTKKARMGKKVKKSKRSAAGGDAEFADDDTGFAGAVKDDDDLDEDEVWQAMTASMPKASGDDDVDT